MEAVKAKIGQRRTLVIPKTIAESLNLKPGQTVHIRCEDEKIIIEPARDAVWLAIYGKKIGYIDPEEVEEASRLEQEKV
jgi:AbrB family looped-hinge helix DNA binding protein